ncbi:hypothetical protein IFM89_038103 [Coptis chinensis]|uniref:ABC transporter domain-containing protein n=1 Tax=Coptis chinensis TaxID=261450 RepID=A0A835MGT3_9MAGN|nr:hypothetical protein IFM89_038103 [Coptis chinensis]
MLMDLFVVLVVTCSKHLAQGPSITSVGMRGRISAAGIEVFILGEDDTEIDIDQVEEEEELGPTPQEISTNDVRKIAGVSIVWKDLTVTVKGKRKYSDKVVKSSNGYALPGTLTGRLRDPAKMFGEVFVNGVKSRLPYGSYSNEVVAMGICRKGIDLDRIPHCPRDAILLALLQLPGFLQKKSLVEDAILAMSLGDYANKLIGGHCYMKGLPNGERRRVNISRELVMRPQILFIDEPLYHLDSYVVRGIWVLMIQHTVICVSCEFVSFALNLVSITCHGIGLTVNISSFQCFCTSDDGNFEETCQHRMHYYFQHVPEQYRSVWPFDRICLLSNGNTLFLEKRWLVCRWVLGSVMFSLY